MSHTPTPWSYRNSLGAGLQILANPGQMDLGGGARSTGEGPLFIYSLRDRAPKVEIGLGDERWVQFPSDAWNEMQLANAQLIVRAVNAHDKLVAAVRAYLSAQGDCDCDTCELARAALAAAEGKG